MTGHEPVMVREVLAALRIRPGETVCDGTLGGAGHGHHLLAALDGVGTFIGLDRDPAMLARGRRRMTASIAAGEPRLLFEARKYEELPDVLNRAGINGADAVLLDLGVNSMQLDDGGRGFSFTHDGPLDGRFNPAEPGSVPVSGLVNTAPEGQIAGWLRDFADERHARRIARRIVERRSARPFERTADLAEVVVAAYPPGERHGRLHPATRTFQALRMAANDELGSVERGVRACMGALNPGGRFAVISFHSKEDRLVKRLFDEAGSPRPDPFNPYSATTSEGLEYRVPRRGAAKPSGAECGLNARARSARLRVIERVGGPT